MSSSVNEAEQVRAAVSRLTGAHFEIRDPREDVPTRKLAADWYIRCREITQASKIPHVQSLWREGNEIRIESLTIGSTSDWIEQAGGEEAVYPVLDVDLKEFGNLEFREEFLKGFPDLKERLGRCQTILEDVSKERGTRLTIGFEGRKGLAVFYIHAVIAAVPEDVQLEIRRIRSALKALREGYRQVALI